MRTLIVDPGFEYSTRAVAEAYYRAFERLGYEVMEYDTYSAYSEIVKMVKASDRKYVWEQVTELVSAPIYNHIVHDEIDLLVCIHGWHINGAIIEGAKKLGCKTALILTDEPQQVDVSKQWSQYYDYVFTNDRGTVGHHNNCHFLPVAADELLFHPHGVQDKYMSDILIGGSFYLERLIFLKDEMLYETLVKYNTKFVGSRKIEFPDGDPRNNFFVDNKITIEEMAKYVAGSKICIDIPRDEYRCGIFKQANKKRIKASCLSPRIFECALAGSLVLTAHHRDDIYDLFEEEMFPVYSEHHVLCSLIDYYMEDEQERQFLVKQQREYCLEHHTYIQRVEKICEVLEIKPNKKSFNSIAIPRNEKINETWKNAWEENIKVNELSGAYTPERSIEKYKDYYKGQRAIIVGNSPSIQYLIKDFQIAVNKGGVVFAMNEALVMLRKQMCPIIWPAYGVIIHATEDVVERSLDGSSLFSNTKVCLSTVAHWRACQKVVEQGNEVIWFHTSPDGSKKEVVDKYDCPMLGAGTSVAYSAITVALYMGFKEIDLWGIDFCYTKNQRYAFQEYSYDDLIRHRPILEKDARGNAVLTDMTLKSTLGGIKKLIMSRSDVKFRVHGNGLLYGDFENLEVVTQ